ncbi:MAG: hypothetical protein Q7S06_01845 [Nanoarchaeota archaeon]|nr:hypothetical protein [Nanoarchaeota archaeon]
MEEKTEWEKFIDLLNELHSKNFVKNDRYAVLLIGLYAEYAINYLFENKTIKMKMIPKNNLNQDIKLKSLHDLGIISLDEYNVLDTLRKIRNEYAHELELPKEKIINRMRDITINWDERNENPNELEKLVRKYPFLKFEMACLTKLAYLIVKKIGESKSQSNNRTIKLHVKIDDKDYTFQIQ